jgi:hypothetical protein
MPKMDAAGYLEVAKGLIGLVGDISAQIAKLKLSAAAAGASDEELATLDVKLTAAIAAREAEQG